MLGSITKNVFSLRNKNILFKRYSVSRVVCNITNKLSTESSKEQKLQAENDGDDNDSDRPIKYSSSKAATMRVDEYRNPHGDEVPWYQPHVVSLSLTVFLVYFCILREENDIDLIFDNELGDTLSQVEKQAQRKTTERVSK